jgi:hypothetical protein
MRHSPRHLTLSLFLVSLALVLAAPTAQAVTRRVDVNTGSDVGGCGPEGSPCASIQRAVNLSATSGDLILVATGTYTYTAAQDFCNPETGVVCVIGKHLTIVGGYASGNWVDRNPVANPTVIDGQNFQRGVLAQRASPNSPTTSLVLDGFRIIRGVAGSQQSAPEDHRGGGLKAGLLTSLTLRDVILEDNLAAGDNTGVNDGGNGAGGGASVSSTPALPRIEAVFERVQFIDNQATGATGPERGGLALGGGLFMDNTNLEATDVFFSGNSATAGTSTGDGVHGGLTADALGGGVAILSETDATFTRFTASGNTVLGGNSSDRGGVGAGGGFYVESTTLRLRDGVITGNTTTGGNGAVGGFGNGAGLNGFGSTVLVERVSVVDNHATGGDGPTTKGTVGGGGGYFNRAGVAGATITLRNAVVADNRIDLGTGGGVVGGGGGGMFFLGHTAIIEHSTFARNVLGHPALGGQAFSLVPRPNGDVSTATVSHSIFADHTSQTNLAAVKVQPTCSVTFNRGLFAGNENDTDDGEVNSGSYSGLGTVLVDSSADFADAGNGDFHLTSSSPAVDEATGSTLELDRERAFRGSPRDLGAYELCTVGVDELQLSGMANSVVNETACYVISVDQYTVGGSGDVRLQAGAEVVFYDGVEIAAGGSLEVVVALP